LLGTMMQTMVCLGIVGVQWVVIGYPLAFGESAAKVRLPGTDADASIIGFSKELVCISSSAAVGKTQEDVLKEKKIDPKTATDEQKKTADEEAAKAKASRFKTFPNTNIPLYLHV